MVRWIIISVVTVVVVVVAAFALGSGALAREPGVGIAPAPLQLPALSPAASGADSTSLDGPWRVSEGSVAGFRVPESFLVKSGTIVGRTSAVTGSLVVTAGTVSSGTFQVDLSRLTIGGKPNASFVNLLETSTYPEATLTLAKPLTFASVPPDGQTLSSQVTVALTMHGITHTVTFPVQARFNGSVLEATGSVPVLASDWNIQSPFGVHNDALIEFMIILRTD